MKPRLLPLLLATPAAMGLLVVIAHVGPTPAGAQGQGQGVTPSLLGLHRHWNDAPRRDNFSQRAAGSYLIQFGPEQAPREMKFQALITLSADGGYVVNNQAGTIEQGTWKRTGLRKIQGAGLAIIVQPDESFSYLRDKVWTIEFDDMLMTDFTITISEADIVPGNQDPLDPDTVGFPMPGPPLPFTGRGEAIPAGIE